MPPRHTYWTILVGSSPTAFRAAERADLVPTFERLRGKHPEVVLKWFARGKLWDSQEAQHDAERAERSATREGPPRDGAWRPGGTHRDPRDRFKKKPKDADGRGRDRRDDREMRDQSARPDRRDGPPRDRESSGKPPWTPKGPPRDREAFAKRPWDPKGPPRDRDASAKRPWTPKGPPRDREAFAKRPWDPKGPPRDRDASAKRPWTPKGPPRDRDASGKPPWAPKGPPRDRDASGKRPWTPKGPPRDRDASSKPPWAPKGPPRDRDRFSKPGDRRSDSRGFAPREGGPPPWRPKPGDKPASQEPPKPDERVEQSRKGGTRLVKKIKR